VQVGKAGLRNLECCHFFTWLGGAWPLPGMDLSNTTATSSLLTHGIVCMGFKIVDEGWEEQDC